jgi:hypothetical protein
MTSENLADLYKLLDDKRISYWDEGKGIRPASVVDGHSYWLGLAALAYWNGVDLYLLVL